MTENLHRLELSGEDADLLVQNVVNEVLNGFRIDDFEACVAVSRDEFRSWALGWREQSKGELAIDDRQAIALRRALALTLQELGSEFQTRTGVDSDEAYKTLAKLDQFVAAAQGGR